LTVCLADICSIGNIQNGETFGTSVQL